MQITQTSLYPSGGAAVLTELLSNLVMLTSCHKTKTLSANVLSFRRDSFAGENMEWDKDCVLMFYLKMLYLREQMKPKTMQHNLSMCFTSEAVALLHC